MWSANRCAVVTQHTGRSHQLIDMNNFCPLTGDTTVGKIFLHQFCALPVLSRCYNLLCMEDHLQWMSFALFMIMCWTGGFIESVHL